MTRGLTVAALSWRKDKENAFANAERNTARVSHNTIPMTTKSKLIFNFKNWNRMRRRRDNVLLLRLLLLYFWLTWLFSSLLFRYIHKFRFNFNTLTAHCLYSFLYSFGNSLMDPRECLSAVRTFVSNSNFQIKLLECLQLSTFHFSFASLLFLSLSRSPVFSRSIPLIQFFSDSTQFVGFFFTSVRHFLLRFLCEQDFSFIKMLTFSHAK